MHNTLKFDINNKFIKCHVHSSLSSLKHYRCEAKSEMSTCKSI